MSFTIRDADARDAELLGLAQRRRAEPARGCIASVFQATRAPELRRSSTASASCSDANVIRSASVRLCHAGLDVRRALGTFEFARGVAGKVLLETLDGESSDRGRQRAGDDFDPIVMTRPHG